MERRLLRRRSAEGDLPAGRFDKTRDLRDAWIDYACYVTGRRKASKSLRVLDGDEIVTRG